MSIGTVLIVDDEATLLRLSQILLQRRGFEVKTALAAKDARNYLVQGGIAELIVLDLMMPDENGFDFLKWKKEQPENIRKVPVIVNTAKNLNDDEKKFLDENTVRIMQKGVQFTDMLVREVESVLAEVRK
ncbi:MAG: hypothetical protein A2020_12475 [Lentisphaerae bacterium GWF2_45_14]|nr:MAG: hypothetical protein A2020_12475 [Lentisphaerae bacterium GWF2_45_14]